MIDADAIVVGAGPVGLAAALALRSHGLDTLVIEAEPADRIRPGSRAIFLHNEPLGLLDRLHPGIAGRILDGGILWVRRRYTYRGKEIYSREYKQRRDSRPSYGSSQSQQEIERVLMEAAAMRGVRFQWGSPVTRVETDGTGVSVTTESGARHRAAYVVGSDGARSAVRKSLAIKMEGSSSDVAFIVADLAELSDRPMPLDLSFHYEHPALDGRNLLMVPMKGAWRVDLQCRPDDDVDYLSSAAGIEEWLAKVVDRRYATRLQWVSTYRFHQLVASTMADATKRVVLIGEAAHLFAPWGGRGLNSGIVDAVSAAGAIAAALRAGSSAEAQRAIDAFADDRYDAALFNRGSASYGLAMLAPTSRRAKLRRRIAGTLAPYWQPAGRWLSTGPNGGDGKGRPGKTIF